MHQYDPMQPSTSKASAPLAPTYRRSERFANLPPNRSKMASSGRYKRNHLHVDLSSSSDDEEDFGRKIDRRQLVQDVAHYFLSCASNPTRGFGRTLDHRKLFINTGTKEFREEVTRDVVRKVDELLGIKVIEDKDGQRYFFSKRNILPADFNELDYINRNEEEVARDETDKFKDGLLLAALTFIFMTKRHLTKDEQGIDIKLLEKFLSDVGEVQEDVFRAFFGPSNRAEFVAQGWITCTINRDLSGTEEVQYDWGPRAEITVDKKKILKYFCEIYGSPESAWPRHMQKAKEKKS